MLQSWNKFCFTSGYIEVAVNLPGPDQNTQGYVRLLSPVSFPFSLPFFAVVGRTSRAHPCPLSLFIVPISPRG